MFSLSEWPVCEKNARFCVFGPEPAAELFVEENKNITDFQFPI
jgi:hypothetical protein